MFIPRPGLSTQGRSSLLARLVASTAQVSCLGGATGRNDDVRTSDSVERMYVSSVEELDTRSMSYMRSHGAYLTSTDSHSKNANFFLASTRRTSHGSDARIDRKSVARVAIDTVSMVLHRSFDAASRRKSILLLQFDHPSGPHTNWHTRIMRRMSLPFLNALSADDGN